MIIILLPIWIAVTCITAFKLGMFLRNIFNPPFNFYVPLIAIIFCVLLFAQVGLNLAEHYQCHKESLKIRKHKEAQNTNDGVKKG